LNTSEIPPDGDNKAIINFVDDDSRLTSTDDYSGQQVQHNRRPVTHLSFDKFAMSDQVIMRITEIVNDRVNEIIDARLLNSLYQNEKAKEEAKEDASGGDYARLKALKEQLEADREDLNAASLSMELDMNVSKQLTNEIYTLRRFSMSYLYISVFSILLLSLILSPTFDARTVATNTIVGLFSTFMSGEQIFGENPKFFLVDKSDGWCFDGVLFKQACDASAVFSLDSFSNSKRYVQIESSSFGTSTGTCLGSNRRGEIGLGSCGSFSSNIWSFENNVLSLLSKKTEKLCWSRTNTHTAFVGACGEYGYTPLEVGVIFDGPAWTRRIVSSSLRYMPVKSFEEIVEMVNLSPPLLPTESPSSITLPSSPTSSSSSPPTSPEQSEAVTKESVEIQNERSNENDVVHAKSLFAWYSQIVGSKER